MTKFDLPTTITTTRDAVLWARGHALPGDKIVVHADLLRTPAASYGSTDPLQSPPVPLFAEGIEWAGPDPFNPSVSIFTGDDQDDQYPVVSLISKLNFGGKITGLKVRGSNELVQNGSWTDDIYNQHAITSDSPLNAATLVECSNVWGDGYYGPGTLLASHVHDVGRHGRTDTSGKSRSRTLQSVLDGCRGRAYAFETGHMFTDCEISDCTIGGNTGYITAPMNGFRFLRNHSTKADVAAGTIKTLANGPTWVNRFTFAGVQSTNIEIGGNRFEFVPDHVKQGIYTPILNVGFVTGGSVHDNAGVGLVKNATQPFIVIQSNCVGVTVTNNTMLTA